MTKLWLPHSAREQVLHCNICGTDFPMRQRPAWERHLRACSERNSEVVDEEVHEQMNADVFSTRALDEEEAWYRKRNAERKITSVGAR